jgi:hypothetical protein
MRKIIYKFVLIFLPNGASHKRQAAAMAPAEAPDTFFRYKSGAYLYINSTDDNSNPARKNKEKTERCRFGYLLSQTRRHTNMINSHETAPGE